MNRDSLTRIAVSRWRLLWGGMALGAAEAIHYITYQRPINITYALAETAAALEQKLTPGHALYGRYFPPQVSAIFLGMVAAALAAGLLQRGRRRVRYAWPALAVAFLGGAFAGMGAVLAEGDTLYHFVGGVAVLQVSSLFMTAFAIPFVFIGLELMSLLGVAGFFELDAGADPAPHTRDPSRLVPTILGAAATAIIVAAGLTTGLDAAGQLLIGALAGLGIARAGMGVEWALLSPDCMASSPRFLSQLGLSQATISVLRRPSALRAWLAAVAMLSLTAFVFWLLKGLPQSMPADVADGRGLHIGHVAGTPLLAIGSVMMIGCEFRTYARLGLGYTTAVAAVPGLLAGYLPGAIWGGSITAWTHGNAIATTSWLPALTESATGWLLIWLVFAAILAVALLLLRAVQAR